MRIGDERPVRLGVNIDHIATVRQARRGRQPDPIEAALVAQGAGASSVVCHLREDRRHIQDGDVRRLRAVVLRLNLEMSIAPDIVAVALDIKPQQVTLVPERRQELTTEGGLDVVKLARRLGPLIERFKGVGIAPSLFIDPIAAQIRTAQRLGAPIIELHTGRYAEATSVGARARELTALRNASQLAADLGLAVAAGHGLDYENTAAVAKIPEIEELNIGFSIVARALSVGMEQAVRQMTQLIARQRADVLQAA